MTIRYAPFKINGHMRVALNPLVSLWTDCHTFDAGEAARSRGENLAILQHSKEPTVRN